MGTVFNGRAYADALLEELKTEVTALGTPPHLAVVYFGTTQSRYVAQKEKMAASLGIGFTAFSLAQSLTTAEAREKLSTIAKDPTYTAIVVQLPLPEQIDPRILDTIPPEKDPDVLSSTAVGRFFNGTLPITPPTASAVMAVLKESGVTLPGASVCLFGHGKLVGQFMVPLLAKEQAIVRLAAHPQEKEDITQFVRGAAVVISATGDGQFLPASILPEESVVIDAGFSLVSPAPPVHSGTGGVDERVVGDIHFDVPEHTFPFVSPVPGGIGPVGVAMLFRNCVQLAKNL